MGLWNPVLGGAINARHLRANVVLSGVGAVIPPIIVVCQIILFNTCQYIFNGCNRLTVIPNTGTGCQSGYGSCTGSGGGGPITPTPTPTPPPTNGGGGGGRARPGSVPYGQIISSCTRNGVVALTFDDGPYMFVSLFVNYSQALINIYTVIRQDSWTYWPTTVSKLPSLSSMQCYLRFEIPPRETNHVRSVAKIGVTQLRVPQTKPSSSE